MPCADWRFSGSTLPGMHGLDVFEVQTQINERNRKYNTGCQLENFGKKASAEPVENSFSFRKVCALVIVSLTFKNLTLPSFVLFAATEI